MKITFNHQSTEYSVDLSNGTSIARPLHFRGKPDAEPKFVPPSIRKPFESGGFTGAIQKGGPCNVDHLDLIPHCHGTHTETVLHILNYPWESLVDQKSVDAAAVAWPVIGTTGPVSLLTAALITVPAVPAAETTDTYRPNFEPADHIVTGRGIEQAIKDSGIKSADALVLRTDTTGDARFNFNSGPETPFLSIEAMKAIVEFGADHLLLDLPSVDRLDDDGHLTAHHIFWNVPEHEHVATTESWLQKTITEMISVPAELKNGLYLLNLQCGPLVSDASPSRPILHPVNA
jgi:hypothetical protein